MQLPHHMPKMAPVPKLIDPGKLAAYVDPLPVMRVAKSIGVRLSPMNASARLPSYRLAVHQMEAKVHRDVAPTRFWAFGESVPGPTIETRSGEGVLVEWVNELPLKHFLPIDHTVMGAEADKPEGRTVVHLHRAKTPPTSKEMMRPYDILPGHRAAG